MKKILLILLGIIYQYGVIAQNITQLSAEQVGRTIEITYVLDVRSDISIFYSIDNGKTFSQQIVHVRGDVGENVAPGKKLIIWSVTEDLESLETNNLRFKLIAIKNNSMVGKGMLYIDVIPSNATICINGRVSTISDKGIILPKGTYDIQVTADGYAKHREKISLGEEEEKRLSLKLEDQKDIQICTNIPATYTINSKTKHDVDSAAFTVPFGKHDLRIEKDGYESIHKQINVMPSGKSKYSFHLQPITIDQHLVMLDYTQTFGKGATPMIGFRYGQVRKIGWYIAADASIIGTHYGYDQRAKDDMDGQSVNGIVPYYTSKVSRNALSLKSGTLVRLGCPLYFYAGLGIGYQTITAERPNGKYVLLAGDWSAKFAFVYEVGLLAEIKHWAIRAGFNHFVGSAQKPCLAIGIGYMFDK